jgi:RNA polymerase sigma-70 factor (ECF subfamily)
MSHIVARRPSEGDRAALIPELAQHRAWLTGLCRRILGSASDADDAAQEALVKAWRAFDGFERRASSQTWMYRIATNVCLDILASQRRRAQPIDLRPGSLTAAADAAVSRRAAHQTTADRHGSWETVDPAELAVRRESIRFAFVTAFRHLPPRQRAVLIMSDVLRWTSVDVAERLGTTVAAVNSALQRARSTLAARDPTADPPARSAAGEHEDLLARYVDAFDRLDVETLVSLLHEDAAQ